MADITRSDKLATRSHDEQTKMVSGPYVLLRIIHEEDSYTLMTATADEDDGSYQAYPELERLVTSAEEVFGRGEQHTDKWGRPYLLFRGVDHPTTIRDLANRIAMKLGLPSVDEPWADEEKRDIYDEFSIGDDGEPVYLSDGVHISKRGRLSE